MYKKETILAQIGNRSETKTGTVNPPIYLSTAYRHEAVGKSTGYDYIRTGNPTRELLEDAIAKLEYGVKGFACSSGMAAIQTVLSLFKSGDEIIVCKDLYGGTYRLFEDIYRKWGLHCTYVSTSNLEEIEREVKKNTKAIFIESPTNPLMELTNIKAVSEIAKKHKLLLICDNTFFTPILFNPIRLGADIVVHSATKYLGGHNDVLAGLIVAKDEEIGNLLSHYHNGIGAVLSPFDSWLLMRGMKTLSLRMKKHEENAKELVTYLSNHNDVTDVLYPGKGGMLSFRIREEKWVDPFLQKISLITFAESLGGVESFITYPATQTHADIPEKIRLETGVCNRLLRFSVGIEHVEDLIGDLEKAFSSLREEVLL
ncbi:MAG: methionine biosynthesis PLP-dependent protein [Bacillaceae bacterium]|nr:methionine biosynthesis PLP-dependent protein [Bacillaceae bacterium]